jgi:hypothetical protein
LDVKVLEEGFFPRMSALWAGSAAEMGHRRREHCWRDPAIAGCSLEDLTPAYREDIPALDVKVLEEGYFPRMSALWAGSAAEMGHRRREHCRRDPAIADCSLEDLTPADREDKPALDVKVLEEGYFPHMSALWAGSAAEMGHCRRRRCRRDPAIAGCSLEDLTPADRENMPAFGLNEGFFSRVSALWAELSG